MRHTALAAIVATLCTVAGCASAVAPAPTASSTTQSSATTTKRVTETPAAGAQPKLASDPARLADDLVADDGVLHDPASPEPALAAAARRQQAAYRAIGRHPEWDPLVRPRIPQAMLANFDRNVDARRQLIAMATVRDTVPAWRVVAPAPAYELLADYREAESRTGVGWNYLAAINFVETRFGSINGTSTAGAQGPMQFLPATFAAFGEGGDIHAPRDSIVAAGRYLAANGFAHDRAHAIFRYNNASEYVRAVDDYAAVLAADPAAFAQYYRWDVYYYTTSGEVLLPIGYSASAPVPVADYLATHPQ